MEGVPCFQAFSYLHFKPSLRSFSWFFYSAMKPVKLHFPPSLSKQTTNWGFIRLTLLLSFKNSKVSFRSNSPPLPLKQFRAARSLSAISYAACVPTGRAHSRGLVSCLLHLSLSLISSLTPFLSLVLLFVLSVCLSQVPTLRQPFMLSLSPSQ